MTKRFYKAVLIFIAFAVQCCEQIKGHRPLAHFTMEPEFIPEGDGNVTIVKLDGTNSSDPFDDPERRYPLSYRWSSDDESFKIECGSINSALVYATFSGKRPAAIELTVTDVDGNSTSIIQWLGLTVYEYKFCENASCESDEDCPEGLDCIEIAEGHSLCLGGCENGGLCPQCYRCNQINGKDYCVPCLAALDCQDKYSCVSIYEDKYACLKRCPEDVCGECYRCHEFEPYGKLCIFPSYP
jgi:hypothetical protein